jgi:hypothetical protein
MRLFRERQPWSSRITSEGEVKGKGEADGEGEHEHIAI